MQGEAYIRKALDSLQVTLRTWWCRIDNPWNFTSITRYFFRFTLRMWLWDCETFKFFTRLSLFNNYECIYSMMYKYTHIDTSCVVWGSLRLTPITAWLGATIESWIQAWNLALKYAASECHIVNSCTNEFPVSFKKSYFFALGQQTTVLLQWNLL